MFFAVSLVYDMWGEDSQMKVKLVYLDGKVEDWDVEESDIICNYMIWLEKWVMYDGHVVAGARKFYDKGMYICDYVPRRYFMEEER